MAIDNQKDCGWPIHWFAMHFMRRAYYEAQGGTCGICGCHMPRAFNSPKLTFDHVWPKSWAAARPESKFLGNLLLAHSRCNDAKGDATPDADQVDRLRATNRKLGLPPGETHQWDAPITGDENGSE